VPDVAETRHVQARIPVDLFEVLEDARIETGQTRTELIVAAIADHLGVESGSEPDDGE
jgi:hypothetical protein